MLDLRIEQCVYNQMQQKQEHLNQSTLTVSL